MFSYKPRVLKIMIHVIGWGIVFGFPFLMMSRSGFNITWESYLRHGCGVPIAFCLVFYINYCILIPRYLFSGKIKHYLALNLLLIAAATTGIHLWQELSFHLFSETDAETIKRVADMPKPRRNAPPKWIFTIRDILSMILTIGLSAAFKLSERWMQTETARQEAERRRTEAELKNLRNQLNPHFLLNTLNNIYALIAFDTDKAQQAVQELSRLLRHVLYENQQNTVPLCKEIDFIGNYIELMRIRLASNVNVDTQFDIHPNSQTPIVPLIFISLIENAFKHGISPTQSSYIRIHFSETKEEIRCEIVNSYHPKANTDKSGSGIGLEQVQRRLELTYPGQYVWKHGVSEDGKEYKSLLIINIHS